MIKKLTPRERKFAQARARGISAPKAYADVFKVKCEPDTPAYNKANDLCRTVRVQKAIEFYKGKLSKQAEIDLLLGRGGASTSWDGTFKFVFEQLEQIRDDPTLPARYRFDAVQVLEKIQDPTQDLNLIWRFVDTVWNGMEAHCPACHTSFPLHKVENEKLTEWRSEQQKFNQPKPTGDLDRRLVLLERSEKGKKPHPSQIPALASPNRHIVGQGPARAGKSHCLSMFGFMFLMVPGAETWLLAATFNDAEKELTFVLNRLHTAFYPVHRNMYEVIMDKKTGDARITTRWNSILEVKSAKSKHSITGHELEGILVAEPGWVDADLLEEVRARMSSRLGRIIAMGSPKGFGGFLGRLVRISQRDGRSGKRLTPGSKMVENGCPWGESILQYHLKAQDNPQYVKSELEAAKKELTEAEYASEFEGRMAGDTDRKFPQIKDDHLVRIPRDALQSCQFVLGVDQGERNFGGCLLAWDGEIIRVVWEYFDNSEKTIKSNLITLNDQVPPIITALGGQQANWQLTIFDADPKIDYQLLELQNESRGWKTEITLRPKNQTDTINWREETCAWLNEMAKDGRLLFATERCDFLHEQLREALIPKTTTETDAIDLKRKRWIIHDPIRKDHVADAFLMACYTLYANMVVMPTISPAAHSPFEEARRAREFRRMADEQRELNGSVDENRLFRNIFGRERFNDTTLSSTMGARGWYDDY